MILEPLAQRRQIFLVLFVTRIKHQQWLCHSPRCQQHGLSSKDGYCYSYYAKAYNPGGEHQWKHFDIRRSGGQHVADLHNPDPRPTDELGQKERKPYYF